MRLDELAGDGKPQAAACAFGVGASAVASPKAVEDKGQVVGRDAVTCIGDGDLDLIAVSVLCGAVGEGRRAEGNLPACGRVAQGIVDEVTQHLVNSPWVAIEIHGNRRIGGNCQMDTRAFSLRAKAGGDIGQEIMHIYYFRVQRQLA